MEDKPKKSPLQPVYNSIGYFIEMCAFLLMVVVLKYVGFWAWVYEVFSK